MTDSAFLPYQDSEEEAECRARLIKAYAFVDFWTFGEGVELAWNVDPQCKLSMDRLSEGKRLLSDDAMNFQRVIQRKPSFRDRYSPSEFIQLARAHGVAFHDDWLLAIPSREPQNDLHPRVRTTLLTLIIGMAMGGYRYNPDAARNNAVADIQADIHQLGMSLGEDTIRTWLKKAVEEVLPQNHAEN